MKSLRVCLICILVDGADFAQGILEPKEKVSLYFSPWAPASGTGFQH